MLFKTCSSLLSERGRGTEAATHHVPLQPHPVHPVRAGGGHVHQGPGPPQVCECVLMLTAGAARRRLKSQPV